MNLFCLSLSVCLLEQTVFQQSPLPLFCLSIKYNYGISLFLFLSLSSFYCKILQQILIDLSSPSLSQFVCVVRFRKKQLYPKTTMKKRSLEILPSDAQHNSLHNGLCEPHLYANQLGEKDIRSIFGRVKNLFFF